MTLFCPSCFNDLGLRGRLEEIRPQFDEGNCSIHPRRKGIPIDAIATVVDEVFRANFDYGGVDYYNDPDDLGAYGPQRGDFLPDAVQGLTQTVDDIVFNALVSQLIEDVFYLPQDGEEPFYVDELKYDRVDAGEGGHGRTWHTFCHTVTDEQRFLNPKATDFLADIFKSIHLQRDVSRRCPIYRIGPKDGLRLHRARIVTDAVKAEIQSDPASHLGPPPRQLGKPNRMNPSGIPAFYASFDVSTCISELRPLVGAEIVSAKFELIRDVVVLDTTCFAAPAKELNLFAKDHIRRTNQWRFMQRFMREIAKPISPNDEHLEYVPTQFVAEYLNKLHEVRIGKDRLHIDAIIYQSAQRPEGKKIVLLGDAAQVEGVSQQRISPVSPWSFSSGERDASRNPAVRYVARSLKAMEVSGADFPVLQLMLYEQLRNASAQNPALDLFSDDF